MSSDETTQLIFNSPDPNHAGYVDAHFFSMKVASIEYKPGAATVDLAFNTNENGCYFDVYGAGLINNSGNAQNINIEVPPIHDAYGTMLSFWNSSTIVNVNINSVMMDTNVEFYDTSSAGSANISFNTGADLSYVLFSDNASAGSASILTQANDNYVRFSGSSSGGSSAITANGSRNYVLFTDNSQGGSANITVGKNNYVKFDKSANAADATITTSGAGSYVAFYDNATGGRSSINLADATSYLDITPSSSSSVTIGSLEGIGTAKIGNKNLTVGSNDRNTTFSGPIVGSGGTFTKTGNGTLTLAGTSTYTGATKVTQGELKVTGALLSTESVGVSSGALLTVAENATINNAAAIALSGTLRGSGTVGAVNATGGVIELGTSGSPLIIDGKVDLDAASSFHFTLGSTPDSYQTLRSDTITLEVGAQLIISCLPLGDNSFSYGDTVKLFENLNGDAPTWVGTFASVEIDSMFAPDSGLYWDTEDLYTKGEISVVPEANTTYLLFAGVGTAMLTRQLRRRRCNARA